jgi:glutamate--cysteine ligase
VVRDSEAPIESDDEPILDAADVESYIHDFSFKVGEPKLVGTELEWLVFDKVRQVVPPEHTLATLGDLSLRGSVSAEPGGQLELSSMPTDLETCVSDAVNDMSKIRDRLTAASIDLVGLGLNPYDSPHLYREVPRYLAMREAFDRVNDAGNWMLCNTASVQIAVDAGREGDQEHSFRRRWHAANAIGPIMVAAFANSPTARNRLTGWRSTRQSIWMQIDPSRTSPPTQDEDPRLAWTRYALDAKVVCIRRSAGEPWSAPEGLTFRRWINDGSPRRPTLGDLRYHLTTLFPPVRPRGYLELRMVDAQRDNNWIVAVAVAKALLDDAHALDLAMESAEPLTDRSVRPDRNPWVDAAKHGLSDHLMGKGAVKCFEAALAALARMGTSAKILTMVQNFTDIYVYRGRCPADDLIDTYRGN